MPSTTSSTVAVPLFSSMVMTPSLPTFSIASASKSPMTRSPLADTVPTCEISARSLQGRARPLRPSAAGLAALAAQAAAAPVAVARHRADVRDLGAVAAGPGLLFEALGDGLDGAVDAALD